MSVRKHDADPNLHKWKARQTKASEASSAGISQLNTELQLTLAPLL